MTTIVESRSSDLVGQVAFLQLVDHLTKEDASAAERVFHV
jgi:hypothetical protein